MRSACHSTAHRSTGPVAHSIIFLHHISRTNIYYKQGPSQSFGNQNTNYAIENNNKKKAEELKILTGNSQFKTHYLSCPLLEYIEHGFRFRFGDEDSCFM